MDDIAFPEIANLDKLFRRLPAGSRQRADRAALSAIRDFDRICGPPQPFEALRDVGNKAMLAFLLPLCASNDDESLCREAFGLRPVQFRPMPLQNSSSPAVDRRDGEALPVPARFRPGRMGTRGFAGESP